MMNMAEETVVVWKQVSMRKAPSFLAVPFSGSEPQARHRALARGKKIPPARAATEGMAGESRASAATWVADRGDGTSVREWRFKVLCKPMIKALWPSTSHQRVGQAEGGLAEGRHNGVGNPVAQAGLDEAASQEVGDRNQPTERGAVGSGASEAGLNLNWMLKLEAGCMADLELAAAGSIARFDPLADRTHSRDLSGEGAERLGEGEHLGDHRNAQAEHGHGAEGQRGGDDAHDGAREQGQQLPGLDADASGRRNDPHDGGDGHANAKILRSEVVEGGPSRAVPI